MYDTVLVNWGDDPKEGVKKIKEELGKHHATGYQLIETITLGKVGCILIFFHPGADYEAASPLVTDPDEIPVDPNFGSTYPPK